MSDPLWLAPFIRSLSPDRLREIVVELACTEERVYKRLQKERAQEGGDDPVELTARYQSLLGKLLKRSNRGGFFDAWEDASNWLDRVEAELLPVAPQAALDLVERFIAADETFFNNHYCDDESSQLLQNACELWLHVAARCGGDQQTRVGRVYDLYCADDYGGRDKLLSQARILLDDSALRALAERFEIDLRKGLGREYHAKSALNLIANVLRAQSSGVSTNTPIQISEACPPKTAKHSKKRSKA
jgi:hypothetical protein